MTIAVHISAGKHQTLADNFNFICFSALALYQPESHFIFIFDSAPSPETYLEPNCTPVILLPTLKNNLLRHYWYNYKLPAIIQRYNVDVCITGGLTCSFRTIVPQCLVVQAGDIGSAETNLYFKRFLPSFLKKAIHIFCVDEKEAEILQSKFALSGKVSMLYPGVKNEVKPLTFEEGEVIKEEFTAGHEYFLHLTNQGDIEKVKVVLKAFSIFKKWQKSSMKMVLSIPPKLEPILLIELRLYKYRDDVLIVSSERLTEKLLSAAYALLLEKEDRLRSGSAALKHKVPLIIDQQSNSPSMYPTALRTTWDDKSIADKMMTLYKDESIRNHIIQTGMDDSTKYSWEETTKKIWEVLMKLTHPQTA